MSTDTFGQEVYRKYYCREWMVGQNTIRDKAEEAARISRTMLLLEKAEREFDSMLRNAMEIPALKDWYCSRAARNRAIAQWLRIRIKIQIAELSV